ncbi:MAG: polysaccharide deacetylase family protein [Epsilonproteobacteria bacterium]|nr:polysaccharide deacetylase family protein [Campylobacterota bacterium]
MVAKSVTIDFEFDWGSRIKSDYAITHVTEKLLQVFKKYNSKGTFFISTETLPNSEKYIKMIKNAGHEIASHGHNHTLDYDVKSKMDLYNQIEKSKKLLEDIMGEKVIGFRTPAFKRSRYTDEVLEELGFIYDSSTTKSKMRNRYKPMQYANSKKLIYVSISTIRDRFPSGIKWMNLFGTKLTGKKPYIIYAHPFDFLSIKDILKLYDKNKIPIHVLLFYTARIGSMLNTLANCIENSQTIKNIILQKNEK